MDINSTKGHIVDPLYQTHPHAKGKALPADGKFNILSLPVDDGGCGWYRVRQYMQELNRQGLANIYILKGDESEGEIAQSIEVADVIVARNGTAPFVRQIRSMDPDKPIVFDHDDNTFKIAASNEHYKDHGTEDVVVDTPDGELDLWVTGNTKGFNRYNNLWRRKELEFLLQASDLNTSPTEKLSSFWAEFNGSAAVTPNAIDFELYPDVEFTDRQKGDEFRIGWQGGVSHMGDFDTVGKHIKHFIRSYKDVYYYTVGSSYDVFFKGVENKIRKFEWLPFKAHPYRMATLDLDLAVIPLQDIDFNDYKSEVKFSEFAALGVPVLVANRLPYVVGKDICVDGVNCLTYDTDLEFRDKLAQLHKDGALRKKLSKNAYEWVREERDLSDWTPKLLNLYKELV